MPHTCTHTIFPGSSKLGVISSVCSTAVSVSWSWKEKSKNRKCVPLADLFNLLLWVGWNGLPPTPDTLHLGCSYHLHSSHRFLSTWGAVRLVQQKKQKKTKNKKEHWLCLLRVYPAINCENTRPYYLLHTSFQMQNHGTYSLPHSQPLAGLVAACSTKWGWGMRLAVSAESVLHKLLTASNRVTH